MGKLSVKRGSFVLVSISRGRKSLPLYGVEGWPRSRGFLCTILRAMQSETKVSVRYRRSGRLSGVVVKSGSTVHVLLYMYYCIIVSLYCCIIVVMDYCIIVLLSLYYCTCITVLFYHCIIIYTE